MKNFVFAFLLFPLFVACNGQSKPEKENISDETQSVLSNEPENVPVHLNKVQFLDKVADYEKNPEQFREVHFAKEEKRQRYEALKAALKTYCNAGNCENEFWG